MNGGGVSFIRVWRVALGGLTARSCVRPTRSPRGDGIVTYRGLDSNIDHRLTTRSEAWHVCDAWNAWDAWVASIDSCRVSVVTTRLTSRQHRRHDQARGSFRGVATLIHL